VDGSLIDLQDLPKARVLRSERLVPGQKMTYTDDAETPVSPSQFADALKR
jgi:hypothetical protein